MTISKNAWGEQLSRRERQVMEILLTDGQATAADIRKRIPQPPSYSAVRALLRVMVEKRILVHESDGPRYLYKPVIPQKKARQSILKQVLNNLFQGSREQMVAALLDADEIKVSAEELERLEKLVRQARKEGR